MPYTFLLPLLEDGLEFEEDKVRKRVHHLSSRSLKNTSQLWIDANYPNAKIKLWLL